MKKRFTRPKRLSRPWFPQAPEGIVAYKIYASGKEVADRRGIFLLQEEAAGVFESMRAYNGKILHAEEHLKRLRESAKTVGYRPIPASDNLLKELHQALKASNEKNTSVRLTLFEGKIFVILGSRAISPELYRKGVVLKTASFSRGNGKAFPCQVKVSAYQQAILASTEPNPGNAFDRLFLDQEGLLAETRVGNFFIVKYPFTNRVRGNSRTRFVERVKAVLLTPPEHLILNGVTRRFVIKCALESGFRVQETPLTRHDFFNADEAFLSNTSWEILPVRELDGRVIGSGKPGPVTLTLHRFLKRRIQHDVASYRSPGAPERL
jgi:branched-chain amino acid aminotransferase